MEGGVRQILGRRWQLKDANDLLFLRYTCPECRVECFCEWQTAADSRLSCCTFYLSGYNHCLRGVCLRIFKYTLNIPTPLLSILFLHPSTNVYVHLLHYAIDWLTLMHAGRLPSPPRYVLAARYCLSPYTSVGSLLTSQWCVATFRLPDGDGY